MIAQTKIYVPLSADEFYALRDMAIRDMRPVRDQARYLLRGALLGNEEDTQNNNTGAKLSEGQRAGVVESTN